MQLLSHTDQLSSMWDNVLSLVMKGVDFELLPMIPESQELSSPLAVNLDQPDGPTYDAGSSEGSLTRDPPQYLIGTHMNGGHSSNGNSFSFPNGTFSTDTSKASIPSSSTARAPPPPPPPGPPLPREDSYTVAMQSISRLIMQIEGVCDSRELKSIDVSKESEAGSVLLDYDKLDKAVSSYMITLLNLSSHLKINEQSYDSGLCFLFRGRSGQISMHLLVMVR